MSGSRPFPLHWPLLCLALLAASLVQAQQTPRRWITDLEGKTTPVEQVYPHSYALLIGINHYVNVPDRNLHFAVADVTELKEELVAHYGFPAKNIVTLLDENASKHGIEAALNRLIDTHKIEEADRILIYFSGHGQTMKLPTGGQMGFLIPSDAQIDLNDTRNVAPYLGSCVSMRSVWDSLDACPARHVLLIADACYSGLLATQKGLKGLSAQALASWQGMRARQILTAGGQGEESEEQASLGHGAFTYKLLEALKLRATEAGRVFLASDLYGELVGPVKDLTEGRQTPQLAKYHEEGEFLFITTGKAHPSPEPVGPKPGGKVVPGSTKALLSVRTAPAGATVYVDKKPIGKTPMSLPIRLGLDDTREVMVGIVLAGYDAQKFTVTLKVGAETTIPEAGGILTLEKLPDALPDPMPDKDHDSSPDKAEPKLGAMKVNDKDGAAMVYVPAGEFLMGDDDDAIKDYSKNVRNNPRHTVKLSGYWIYKTLVTVKQYKKYVAAMQEVGKDVKMPGGPAFDPDWSKEDHPMVNVSWEDAQAYCAWAGVQLPSEAQWEKAARGTDGRKYPWGDSFDRSKLWCSKSSVRDAGGTASVGSFVEGASPCGALDMAGNVWEWCEDWYFDKYWESRSADRLDPVNTSVGEQKSRCLRGGSWGDFAPVYFRCAYRRYFAPRIRSGNGGGFRCVRQDSK